MSDPTAQTPAAPTTDVTGAWDVSLAEIDAMGLKAARGAGFAWGMAQEAGRAARWLASYGLPGPETLANLLQIIDGENERHTPVADGPVWHGRGGPMCPIHLGTVLSDRAHEITDSRHMTAGALDLPILVLPFLCRVARDLDMTLMMELQALTAYATPTGPALEDLQAPWPGTTERLVVSRVAASAWTPRSNKPDAHTIRLDIWRVLDGFAQRTYVPTTEQSRATGAGSGLDDND